MIFLAIIVTCSISSSVAAQTAVPANLTLGAFPVWYKGSVYVGDLFTPSVTRISSGDNRVYKAYFDTTQPTAYIAPIADQRNRFIATIGNRLVKIAWDGYSSAVTELETLFTGPPETALGNLVVARDGVYYIGGFGANYCLSEATNSVWKYTANEGFTRVVSDLVAAYGLALDEARNLLYVNNPCSGIYAYDRDPSTGDLSNGRIVFAYTSDNGDASIPVGVAVTYSGLIVTDIQSRGTVLLINPETGAIVSEYRLPTPITNPPAFGGPNGDTLIVASSTQEYDFFQDEPIRTYGAPAGSVFEIRGFAQGNPPLLPRSDIQ